MSLLRFALRVVLVLTVAATAAAADRPPIVASKGDAFIARQGADIWWIGSRDLEVVIGLNASRELTLQRITNLTTGRNLEITPAPDAAVTLGGQRLALGATGSMAATGVDTRATENGVELTFTFESRSPRVEISRTYACYPGSPTIETWTRISSLGDAVTVSDLVGWQMTMRLARVRWLGGLRGDAADSVEAGAFGLADRDLEPGERIEIGAEGRSTEQFIPFVIVDDGRDELYGGLMWSGSWHITFERADDRLRVAATFPGITTTVTGTHALEVPHSFFGLTTHSRTDESGALRQFIMRGVRHGRPFSPLVTYNTWFAYGTRLDEDTMIAAMDAAASLGVELFVMDAGWWVGAGENDDFDFESGIGSWAVDPDRFPSGLASMADYAHGVGMKFGLWVEPERVALSTVGRPGLAHESWLATRGGDYGAPFNGQVCLAHPDAREWIVNRLIALIDQVRPDYLKWDNNFWINCDRSGHGHGAGDGNLAHVQALYGILATLRALYPDLLIENVSGGGNRLDFGMLAHTDVAWMDDRSAPSAHVRHNLEGLTAAFPPAYLLSFVIDSEGEPIHGSPDLPAIIRSRMPGVFGMTFRAEDLDEELVLQLSTEIARYKQYRDTIAGANATLLTGQAPADDQSWDVLEELTDDGRQALIFAFKTTPDEGRTIVRPRSLIPDATYAIYSADVGLLGEGSGAMLMEDGIEIDHGATSVSRAHMIVLALID